MLRGLSQGQPLPHGKLIFHDYSFSLVICIRDDVFYSGIPTNGFEVKVKNERFNVVLFTFYFTIITRWLCTAKRANSRCLYSTYICFSPILQFVWMLILQTLHRRLPFVKSVLVGGCAMDHKLGAKFDSMLSVISAIRCRILTFSSFRSATLFSSTDVCLQFQQRYESVPRVRA